MHNAKQNAGKELNVGVKTEKCPKDDEQLISGVPGRAPVYDIHGAFALIPFKRIERQGIAGYMI